MKVLLLVLLCSVCVYAKSKRAPLPDALVHAKTLHLVNKTGKQAILDSAYNEFEEAGRFKVVEDKEVDLIAVFSRGSIDDPDDNGPAIRMEVTIKGDEDPAFETTERTPRHPAFTGCSCVISPLRNALKTLRNVLKDSFDARVQIYHHAKVAERKDAVHETRRPSPVLSSLPEVSHDRLGPCIFAVLFRLCPKDNNQHANIWVRRNVYGDN